MSNVHLKDKRLSLRAAGLLSKILSLPPEWDYTVSGLVKITSDGVDSVRSAIRELEKFGYITRKQLRDERGRMAQNEYHVYEDPKVSSLLNFNHRVTTVDCAAFWKTRTNSRCLSGEKFPLNP